MLGWICFWILLVIIIIRSIVRCDCMILEKSCKGVTGMILKCKNCGRRFKILWEDYAKIK